MIHRTPQSGEGSVLCFMELLYRKLAIAFHRSPLQNAGAVGLYIYIYIYVFLLGFVCLFGGFFGCFLCLFGFFFCLFVCLFVFLFVCLFHIIPLQSAEVSVLCFIELLYRVLKVVFCVHRTPLQNV